MNLLDDYTTVVVSPKPVSKSKPSSNTGEALNYSIDLFNTAIFAEKETKKQRLNTKDFKF